MAWFKSYLSDRLQCVMVKGAQSGFRGVNTGIPQGSILGPLLFTVFINDLCNLPYCGKILKYVYTPMMRQYFAKAKKLPLLRKRLNVSLKKIVDHIEKDDLMLNIKKCKIMLFGTRKTNQKSKCTLDLQR